MYLSYHGDGNEEYCWEHSHIQAISDVQIYSNQPMKPNGDDAHGW